MEKKTEEKPAGRGTRRAIVAVAAIIVALLFFSLGWLGHWLSMGRNARSLLWAVRTAEKEYYREVDGDALYGEFFSALALDPYSEYYTREEYAAVYASNAGEGEDNGIVLSPYENGGGLRVYRAAGNSSAERAGICRGMYIYRFGESGETLTAGDAAAYGAFVRSHARVVLECGFSEDGSDAALYTVESGKYVTSYCEYRDAEGACRFVNGKAEDRGAGTPALGSLAYIRIDEFYGRAAEEFALCLGRMRERGKTGLVLDLRCNGGGYLSVFCDIAAYLMKDAKGNRPVAATAKYRSGKEETYRASGNFYGDYFGGDMQVYLLADERTASASECLIGALVSSGTLPYGNIYLRKGTEARTYGKGIMQSHFTDAAGNVLKLTVAEIFWPDGTSIHGKGVREEDGAVGIAAPLLPGSEDVLLEHVLEMLS